MRRGRAGEAVLAVFNFTPVVRSGYRMGRAGRRALPGAREHRFAESYGGGNVGNAGWLETTDVGAHGHAQSIVVTLPPLGGLILQRQGHG